MRTLFGIDQKWILFFSLLLLMILFGVVVEHSAFAQTSSNQQSQTLQTTKSIKNTFHPPIVLRNATGDMLTGGQKMSPEQSCGSCHDTAWIETHNIHYNEKIQVNCVQCHLEGGKLPLAVDFVNVHEKIGKPKNENCATCHGTVHQEKNLYSIPANYEKIKERNNAHGRYAKTQLTGTIFSAQIISKSGLNLANKKYLHTPFDVHANAQVSCTDCHYSKNSPSRYQSEPSKLAYLRFDPRRGSSIKDYLERPDHRLQTAACQDCHNPMAGHSNLPAKQRHLESMQCQSCHVPAVYGPAFRSVDFTVAKADGSPLIEYRQADKKDFHQPFSTLFQKGYHPFLAINKEDNKLAPYHFTTWYYWQDQQKKDIPFEAIQKAMLHNQDYHPEILVVFDSNQDGKLSATELVLDNLKKINILKERLLQAGFSNPQIKGKVTDSSLTHGVVSSSFMQMNCQSCHGKDNRIQSEVFLSSYSPHNTMPELDFRNAQSQGKLVHTSAGIFLERDHQTQGRYIFGSTRSPWVTKLGVLFFALSVLGVAIHGSFRFLFTRKNIAQAKTKREYIYTFYERMWHWTMAISILLLIITGMEIQFTGHITFFGLMNTVAMHNVLGFIVAINALLSLFYHVATGAINQYFRFNRNFFKEMVSQVFYYLNGIFRGEPHPVSKQVYRKINPLQQLTYVMLLNILLPLQIITGLFIWLMGRSDVLNEFFSGLIYLAPVHSFASWLFLAFVVLHVYLTTTGHTITSNIEAMITGYDKIEKQDKDFIRQQQELMKKPMPQLFDYHMKRLKRSIQVLLKKENKAEVASAHSKQSKQFDQKPKDKLQTTKHKKETVKTKPKANKNNPKKRNKKGDTK